MTDKIPLLIDTDPGVDDALALLMAFDDPAHEVVGLTIAADIARSHGGALRLGQSEALGGLRAEVDGGAHPATVVSARTSGIFWKERDAVTAQLRIWDSVRVARLMSRLFDCERALKSSGTPGGVLFRKLMTDIAHQAARAR